MATLECHFDINIYYYSVLISSMFPGDAMLCVATVDKTAVFRGPTLVMCMRAVADAVFRGPTLVMCMRAVTDAVFRGPTLVTCMRAVTCSFSRTYLGYVYVNCNLHFFKDLPWLCICEL